MERMCSFKPFPYLSSPHLQTIISSFLPSGAAPPSAGRLIDLGEGDRLSCHVSTPAEWSPRDPTAVLIHGMGGSHESGYMVRIARKLFHANIRCVRANLRGAGSGAGLSRRPYHAGTSSDVLCVLQDLKREFPDSNIALIGFSLGGNIILKLAGELGEGARELVRSFIAVCPPLDLEDAVLRIEMKRNRLYHSFYLSRIRKQAGLWGDWKNVKTLSYFDDAMTARLWGFANRHDYYKSCSSLQFIPKIRQTAFLLFAQDDPFISWEKLKEVTLPPNVRAWLVANGGHMGFLGSVSQKRGVYALDSLLLEWIREESWAVANGNPRSGSAISQ